MEADIPWLVVPTYNEVENLQALVQAATKTLRKASPEGFAMLIVQALDVGAYAGAAVVGAFLALFGWQSGNYFWRNRPGRYRPDALPKALVPDG